MMPTLLAAVVAAFAFAVMLQFKPWIILGGFVVLLVVGFAWLTRRHPCAAIALVGFLRGLLGSRW